MKTARGRLTVVDVLAGLFALAMLGALYPVFRDGFSAHRAIIGQGTEYLWLLILPVALLVMLGVMFSNALGGAR